MSEPWQRWPNVKFSEVCGGTPGSIPFFDSDGCLDEDNPILFYDPVNRFIGFGTNTPTALVHIEATDEALFDGFDTLEIDSNSLLALLIEQNGVNNNTFIVDTMNGWVGINKVPTTDLDILGDVTISGTLTTGKLVADELNPVGSLSGLLKSLGGTPALKGTWVECNGQVISDSESPLDGDTIPNLNGSGGGTKRFIKGSTTSGTTGGSATQFYSVNFNSACASPNVTPVLFCANGVCVILVGHTHPVCGNSDTKSNEPAFYEAPWIVRIK